MADPVRAKPPWEKRFRTRWTSATSCSASTSSGSPCRRASSTSNRVDPEYYSWDVSIENGLEYFRVTPGPILDRVMEGRYLGIRQFLDLGFNVVADDVIWKREWLLQALQLFEDYRVYFVGVFVSDAEGARRETARGDRHAGWDRGSARFAHHDAIYDMTVDTTDHDPEQCALEIKRALADNARPKAFAEMRRRFFPR